MKTYRRKPVMAEAKQLTDGESAQAIMQWINDEGGEVLEALWAGRRYVRLEFRGRDDREVAVGGNWVVHQDGEFHSLTDGEFQSMYEEVSA